MGFVSMLLLPILLIFGFIAIIVAVILVICAIIFLVFTPLSVVMFVKSHKRKKQNKRMVPYFPLGFVFSSFALGGLIPFLVIGGIYVSNATKYPASYVKRTIIDQEGYQDYSFTVGCLTYRRIDNIDFNYNIESADCVPIYSYTYSNPLKRSESGNYYRIPLKTASYTILKGRNDGSGSQYFTLDKEYDDVVNYFTSLSCDTNVYDFSSSSYEYSISNKKFSDNKAFFQDNIQDFLIESYKEQNKTVFYPANLLAAFSMKIYDENRFVTKGLFYYCLCNDGNWYLMDGFYYSASFIYKFSDDVQGMLNYLYEI